MKNRIKSFINRSAWASKLYWHYVYLRKAIIDRDKIRRYVADTEEYHSSSLGRIVHVMVCKLWLPDEYVGYGYENLTPEERKDYVLDWEKDAFCKRVNTAGTTALLNNKISAFSYLEGYYKRKVVLFTSDADEKGKACIRELFEKGAPLMVKPVSSGGGKGIIRVDPGLFRDEESFEQSLIDKYPKGCVVEELIIQDERMAVLHPQSINTVRMPTVRHNGQVELFHPFMRVGRGGSVVDNGGSGGLLMPVDVHDGRVLAAANELGKSFVSHPDSGVQLIGFSIPRWNEAVALAKELMSLFPKDGYISWDLALTKTGWIVVEGNSHGQFAGQYPLKHGIRSDFERINGYRPAKS